MKYQFICTKKMKHGISYTNKSCIKLKAKVIIGSLYSYTLSILLFIGRNDSHLTFFASVITSSMS